MPSLSSLNTKITGRTVAFLFWEPKVDLDRYRPDPTAANLCRQVDPVNIKNGTDVPFDGFLSSSLSVCLPFSFRKENGRLTEGFSAAGGWGIQCK